MNNKEKILYTQKYYTSVETTSGGWPVSSTKVCWHGPKVSSCVAEFQSPLHAMRLVGALMLETLEAWPEVCLPDPTDEIRYQIEGKACCLFVIESCCSHFKDKPSYVVMRMLPERLAIGRFPYLDEQAIKISMLLAEAETVRESNDMYKIDTVKDTKGE